MPHSQPLQPNSLRQRLAPIAVRNGTKISKIKPLPYGVCRKQASPVMQQCTIDSTTIKEVFWMPRGAPGRRFIGRSGGTVNKIVREGRLKQLALIIRKHG